MSSNTQFLVFLKEKPSIISLILNKKSEKHECLHKLLECSHIYCVLCVYETDSNPVSLRVSVQLMATTK